MSDPRGLYLKPPEKLPSTGVTKVTFKVFINQLTAYLEQDPTNYMFLRGGVYNKWSAKQLGLRITKLASTDPDKVKLDRDLTNKDKDKNTYDTEIEKLKLLRNSQVGKFIQLFAVLCYYTEQDDIDQCSTSFNWIVQYLEKHYNIESRGAHFLDIAALTYKKGTPHQTFYKQFRAAFMDNLRKQGEKLEYRCEEELTADEKMTPTLEATIILWSLERIDLRLPVKVQKMYGHQMVGNKCLVTLQPTIFQNIPLMIQELDESDSRSSANSVSTEGEATAQLNAGWTGGGRGPGRYQSRGGRGRGQYPARRGGRDDFRGGMRGSKDRNFTGNKFCRICYHAGSPRSAYQNHSISECTLLSSADKSDLRAILGSGEIDEQQDEDQGRHEVYEAPGWDIDDNESSVAEINLPGSYLNVLCEQAASSQYGNPVVISTITPIPSQTLDTYLGQDRLTITLDSGATLTFIKLSVAKRLGLKISPNGQLALLADEETRMASLGEIDTEVVHENIILRLRGLVMNKLQADCFGGTNFHKDNQIQTDIAEGTITLHGCHKTKQSNPLRMIQSYPPSRLTMSGPDSGLGRTTVGWPGRTPDWQEGKRSPTISVPYQQSALPDETITISVPESIASVNRIAILPNFSSDNLDWPPQVCEVTEGRAVYTNPNQDRIISHPKHAHFKTLPVVEMPFSECMNIKTVKAPHIPMNPVSAEELIKDIKINTDLVTKKQADRIREIHIRNQKAFDGDLTGGYNHRAGNYYASFSFKENSKPPPLKVWAPQYNRTCSELLQAKCDQLEAQGVLADPSKHRIDIKHVSPIFIQQKGRAKHKQLQDCSLDELRFISVQNVLNENIRPVPSLSTSHIRIFKFLARWRYHLFADMLNSYFQLPIEKRLWGYLAINTPYRGMRVMTRAGQGLLNSDVHLDQLLMKVLGDELAEGICEIARDDIQVGGNSVDELINNWDRVLSKLNKNNLKITAQKVRILLDDSEVYGFRITRGHVMPSSHIISNLGLAKMDDIKTIKQVNSWKGLFKTLLAHVPHLAFYMSPFDSATAGKNSKDKFTWTPELRAAFNSATGNLSRINKTYLPHPDDKLFLKPDTAKVKACTGWALYAAREIDGETRLLPVQYCSAKLPVYMAQWYPCELEAVGAVLSIDQVSHWINESNHTTTIMPDSMPVVKAANLMKSGKHSKNPRLQSLLSCVNRRNITFVHNSAKGGLHRVPDALSRLDTKCSCKDCAVKRFLEEIPTKVELMGVQVPADVTSAILCDMEPCQVAVMTAELNDILVNQIGAIPFGNKKAWLEIQKSDTNCRVVHSLKVAGNLPVKKKTNKIINRLFRECTVSEDGLLVVNRFDQRTMRHVDRIVVPPSFLSAILSLIHIRLKHPLTYQLQSIFEKYFFSIGVNETCKQLRAGCDFCTGLDKIPRELQVFDPKLAPAHPGSHMNVDVMRRAGQKILVSTDMFSGYTTACFTETENREDLADAVVQAVTPVRNSAVLAVRVDQAPAFQSLMKSKSEILESNGIVLDLADDLNKNANCVVDKKIQELEDLRVTRYQSVSWPRR